MDYKQAGVNIDSGNNAVRRIRDLARATFTPGVLSEIGSFGGLFKLDATRYREPILVSSADGVGTKLKVAFLANAHGTCGADLVNHCVNDILAHGAEPLFFLDYLATGRLLPEVAAEVVGGIARACRANGCALIGGETAEMPGFYADGEYDLAGFIVGIVERRQLIDGAELRSGDCLIGLPASGLHTNGYSLARRIVFDMLGLDVHAYVAELESSVGEALLQPHRSYLDDVRPLLGRGLVKGMAHITGGGIADNLSRILPPGAAARIDRSRWTPPGIFRFLQQKGSVPDADMYRTFNMGIGFIVACARDHVDEAMEILAAKGQPPPPLIGQIVAGHGSVVYES